MGCNLCLLIGVNPRYESSYLNLKLKKRFLKGNIKFFSLNSKKCLTYPTTYLGTNLEKLKKNSKNLMTVINNSILNRKDSSGILNLVLFLDSLQKNNWRSFNLLNSAINTVGISFIDNFKILNKNDLKNNSGMFFINCNLKTNKFYYKLLKQSIDYYLFNSLDNYIPIIVEQNFNNSLSIDSKTGNYYYFPTNNFFETSASYINTEGTIKRTAKIISTLKTKDNWQLIRKLILTLKNVTFFSDSVLGNGLIYNSKNIY